MTMFCEQSLRRLRNCVTSMKAIIRTEAIRDGRLAERSDLIALLRSRICFDHKMGKCSHSACYELSDIVSQLENKS